MSDPDLKEVIEGLATKVDKLAEKPVKAGKGWMSRKFLTAVVSAVALVLAEQYGVSISPDTQIAIVGILATWLLVEGANDFRGQKK